MEVHFSHVEAAQRPNKKMRNGFRQKKCASFIDFAIFIDAPEVRLKAPENASKWTPSHDMFCQTLENLTQTFKQKDLSKIKLTSRFN